MINIFKLIKNKLKENKKYRIKPHTVIIDISNRCNASCPFCSRQLSEVKRNNLMSKEMFYEIMAEVKKIKKVKNICFAAWGEPMLHPNFDEFANFVIDQGYKLSFPTNMSLADKHFDTLLKVDSIMMSIEGHDKESYEKKRLNLNFEKTYANIVKFNELIEERKKENKSTPKRVINYLVSQNSHIDEFMHLWRPLCDEMRVGPILPLILWNKEKNNTELTCQDNIKSELIPCNDFVKDMFCFQVFNTIVIRANGNLALCCSDYDIDLDFGTYKNLYKTFKTNKNLNKIRQEFRNKKLNICKNCFQNYEVKKEHLFSFLPELEKYDNQNDIKIYTNR